MIPRWTRELAVDVGPFVVGLAVAAMLWLNGCAGQQITLTDAAQAACRGQAAANVAGEAAAVLGQPGVAATSSAISVALGTLCKW